MRQSGWSKYQISDGIEKIGCYTGAKHTASVLIIKQQWNHSWHMMTNPNINDLMKFKNSESQERQSQHLTDFYRWNWIFYLYLFSSGETKYKKLDFFFLDSSSYLMKIFIKPNNNNIKCNWWSFRKCGGSESKFIAILCFLNSFLVLSLFSTLQVNIGVKRWDRLSLTDLLAKPHQRIPRYRLLIQVQGLLSSGIFMFDRYW